MRGQCIWVRKSGISNSNLNSRKVSRHQRKKHCSLSGKQARNAAAARQTLEDCAGDVNLVLEAQQSPQTGHQDGLAAPRLSEPQHRESISPQHPPPSAATAACRLPSKLQNSHSTTTLDTWSVYHIHPRTLPSPQNQSNHYSPKIQALLAACNSHSDRTAP